MLATFITDIQGPQLTAQEKQMLTSKYLGGIILFTRHFENIDQLKKTSPNFHIDKIKAPLLIVHGRRDYNVRIEQAETLMNALDEKNIPYEVLIKKEEGHGFRLEENRVELYTVMEKFFEKNLSKPSLRSD